MKSARAAVALAWLGLAAGCGNDAPIATADAAITVSAGRTAVDFGMAFPLTVVRTWRDDLTPDAWDDAALAPFSVRLVSITHRSAAHHMEETRLFDAYAFQRTTLTVPPLTFRVRGADGAPQSASAPALTLAVTSALGPAPATRPANAASPDGTGAPGADAWPGPAELPGDPLPEPFGWRAVASGAAGIVALAVLVWWLRRRAARATSAPVEAVAVAAPAPDVVAAAQTRARARLDALRARTPESDATIEAWYVEASSLLRDFLHEAFGVPSFELTTEECLASAATARALDGEQRALLGDVLPPCDLVKFARAHPGAADRAALIATAVSLIDSAAPTPHLEPVA